MSKPWKQIKIFTCDSEQSVIIEPSPGEDGVCIHSNEEPNEYHPPDISQTFCLYASYDEALAIAKELINFVKLNQNKDD